MELGDAAAATIAAAAAAEQAPAVAPAYGAVARYALVRARLATAGADPDMVAELAAAAGELRSAGWVTAADEATLAAASAALAAGDPAGAAALSAPLTAAPARRLPAAARLRRAHAVAVHRLATGDRAGARRAVRSGLRVLDQHRASLGATELRAHAAAAGQRLAELGLGMALVDGDGRRVLAWAERARAASLRLDAARDPDDPELTADLARLRGLAEGGVSGAAASRGDDDERRRLERRVADRLRRSRRAVAAEASLTPAALVAAVADHALVEYVRDGAVLAAVVVSGGRARLVRLGVPLDALGAEVDATGFALRRLIRASVTGRHVGAAVANLEAAAAQLDALVVAPVADYLADRAVVVVPTAPLHGVPWSALPTLADRPVAVASSATLWARAEAAATDPCGGVLLVAGPDLPGAPLEVAELAPLHRDASVLAGAGATSGALSAALPAASLLHVAAHGRFRADNPLFSSLLLADGPLTANDLERLQPLPPHVVLAACEVGQAEVRAGDELLGLASVLFPAGVRTLVASLALAPDAATHVLMAAYHRAVAAGAHPATALTRRPAGRPGHGPRRPGGGRRLLLLRLGLRRPPFAPPGARTGTHRCNFRSAERSARRRLPRQMAECHLRVDGDARGHGVLVEHHPVGVVGLGPAGVDPGRGRSQERHRARHPLQHVAEVLGAHDRVAHRGDPLVAQQTRRRPGWRSRRNPGR